TNLVVDPQARSHDLDTLARLHGVPLRRRAVRDARFASPQLPLKRQAPSRSQPHDIPCSYAVNASKKRFSRALLQIFRPCGNASYS
ncbi:hypothetical protein, partial [Faecalibacterium prausnitzii]|uniref:hypothetical protein n=1 Tax=Faecalibacterium prausnitzii TaxID=853 RepID=UPI0019D659BA